MNALSLKIKIEETIKAVEEYQKTLNEGTTSMWDIDVRKGLESLTEKRHMLGSSGQTCSCCNGSGRG